MCLFDLMCETCSSADLTYPLNSILTLNRHCFIKDLLKICPKDTLQALKTKELS